MSWLFLAGLGIIWAVCIFPRARRASPATSVEEFERNMDRLAETGRTHGRWIIAPRKGAQFLGARNRARVRARERRRRVFMVLVEALGLTFLMGLFPPLRPMWFAAAAFAGLLFVYVWMLLAIRRGERHVERMREQFAAAVEAPAGAAAIRAGANGNGNGHRLSERHVSNGRGRATRRAYNGLGVVEEEEVHVVVRSGRGLQPASAR
jgi:Flp pilus assembly protein TadB